MKFFTRLYLALLLGLFSEFLCADTASENDKVISIRADAWPPYNARPHAKNPGYMIEIAEYAFKKHGYTLDYQILPWQRSIEMASKGAIDCLVGAYRDEVPDFIFPRQHLALDDVGFFGRIDARSWKFESLDSFEGYTIGVIGGYSYGPLMDRYVANGNNKVHISKGDDALSRNLKMLMHKRIDIVLESFNVMSYQKTKLPFAKNIKLLDKYPLQAKVYIACTPKNPLSQTYVDMIDEGLTELRKNGKLKKILKKYGLEDWEKPHSK